MAAELTDLPGLWLHIPYLSDLVVSVSNSRIL